MQTLPIWLNYLVLMIVNASKKDTKDSSFRTTLVEYRNDFVSVRECVWHCICFRACVHACVCACVSACVRACRKYEFQSFLGRYDESDQLLWYFAWSCSWSSSGRNFISFDFVGFVSQVESSVKTQSIVPRWGLLYAPVLQQPLIVIFLPKFDCGAEYTDCHQWRSKSIAKFAGAV